MEITLVWVLAQIATAVEYGLLGASYLVKSRKLVVILDILSTLGGIATFVLLGADLGMAMLVIILLANFYYLWDEHVHNEKERAVLHKRDYAVLAAVLIGIGVVTVLTYDGPLSLLSVAATVLYEVSIWQKNNKVYKFLGIPVAASWMLYDLIVDLPVGALCESVILIASTVGYVQMVREEKRQKSRKIAKRTVKARKNVKL